MFLYDDLLKRAANNAPVKVGLIGAGKFGSMFLSQVPSTPGLEVRCIADLNPARARQTCLDVGWPEALVDTTQFFDDAVRMMETEDLDVVVEATGNPVVGVVHARTAIRNGHHIVMVNVEADVLAGALLAREAKAAGVVYSMAYGDQPALTCEMVDWARSTGFSVVAAGKGTKYLPSYHASTPDTVWDHYGLTAEQAAAAGMNSQMFNSFLDGTKSALEMAAIANATGLAAPDDGLLFPPAGMDDLAHILRPQSEGGQLQTKGQVEVVSSLERDGRPVFKDLRWGVYVVIEAPTVTGEGVDVGEGVGDGVGEGNSFLHFLFGCSLQFSSPLTQGLSLVRYLLQDLLLIKLHSSTGFLLPHGTRLCLGVGVGEFVTPSLSKILKARKHVTISIIFFVFTSFCFIAK